MEYTDIFRRKLGTNQMLLTSSNIRPNMFCKIIFLTEAIILLLVNTCPIALQNS